MFQQIEGSLVDFTRLDWTDSDSIGLERTGVDWTGPDRTGFIRHASGLLWTASYCRFIKAVQSSEVNMNQSTWWTRKGLRYSSRCNYLRCSKISGTSLINAQSFPTKYNNDWT